MSVSVKPQLSAEVRAEAKIFSVSVPKLRTAPQLKVLQIGKYYPPYRGGMESHLEMLSSELKSLVDLKVIVANSDHQTTTEMNGGIDLTRVGKLFNINAAPICRGMVGEIRRAKADIVHIHWPNPTAVLAYLMSGHQGRLVFTYHSDIVRQKKMAGAFMPILHYALRKAAAIIVSSPNYIKGSDVLTAFREKCRIIPFGVSARFYAQYNQVEAHRIREKYGPRLVLGVGRMVYYKGFEHLVRAMAIVEGRLVIIGEGPLRPHLEKLVLELGLKKRVTFLDQVEDVRPFYHAADIFALSSIMRSEAFGIVQLEAMACGKPVINTQLDSGVPFVSPNGVSGVTVAPGDSQALGNAINRLFDNANLRALLGKGARNRVVESFTVEKMVRETFDLYQAVMN